MGDDQGLAGAPRTTRRIGIDSGQVCIHANLALPERATGWVILVPPSSGHAPSDALFSQVTDHLQHLGLATMIVDLGAPRVTARHTPTTSVKQATRRLSLATDWLRAQMEWQGLPVNYFGVGRGAAVALRAAPTADVNALITWNGRPELAWRQLGAVSTPTLLLLGSTRPRLRWWCNRLAYRRLGAIGQLQLISGASAPLAAQIADWAQRDHTTARTIHAAACRSSTQRPVLMRHVATGALALSLGLPIAAIPAAAQQSQPGAAVSSAGMPQLASRNVIPADPFADGITIGADAIRGDGAAAPHRGGKAHRPQHARSQHRGYVYHGGAVLGDGMGGISPQATGSQGLIDAGGLKWFANTNITFATSSSASAAMSEASFTHAVAATTLNSGTTASTLNDAFDGYNSLCVSFTGASGPCATGNAAYTIYNTNGSATNECLGAISGVNRQIVFNPQTMGSITVSRKVFVPDNDTFARWLNFFTNTGGTPQTLTMSTSNNLGSDSNTRIVTSSNGDTTADLTDTWVSSFQSYSGTTSSDVRLGHVLQGPGAAVPLSNINFVDGDDNPFWAYTFTLAPGETKAIMDFATGQPTKAAANAKAAELVGLPPNALSCLTPTEIGQVVNFTSGADLSIAATATPDPVLDGGTLTYNLQVTNAGPGTADTVTVADTLPTGATFVSASGTGWTCNEVGGVVTCTATSLALGPAPAIAIAITVNGSGTLSNSATVSSTTNDANAANNSTTITSNSAQHADLALVLSAAPAPVNVGSNLTYTLGVTNGGPSSASNITITDTLPTGVAFVSATGAGWACSQISGTVTCTAASLATGAAPQISVVVTPSAAGSLINSATVASTASDTNTANNTATNTVSALAADLAIALTQAPNTVPVGNNLSYNVNITNNGPSDATNVVVHDTLPAGVTFVSASGTGWACSQAGGVITCTLPTLVPGTAPTISVVVKPTTLGATITTVNVSADETDSVPGNNTDSTTTTASTYQLRVPVFTTSPARPDLLISEVTLSPNKSSFAAGEPVVIKVKVTNRGNADAASFWVDLYLNPSSPPTAANQPWNSRCGLSPCFGIAWTVNSLAPGESVVLSSADIAGGYSAWPGWLARGTTDLYVYADSWKLGVSTGAADESNETNNRAEIHGLSVTGSNPRASSAGAIDLPLDRPDLPSH